MTDDKNFRLANTTSKILLVLGILAAVYAILTGNLLMIFPAIYLFVFSLMLSAMSRIGRHLLGIESRLPGQETTASAVDKGTAVQEPEK